MPLAIRVPVEELKQCCGAVYCPCHAEEPMSVDDARDSGPASDAAGEHSADPGDRDGADQTPQGSISTERLREVLRRIKTGFYDRPEVPEEIARRLTRDLDEGPGKP